MIVKSKLCAGVCAWLCVAAACWGQARADWTLTSADMKQKPKIVVNTWSPDEGLSYSTDNGELAKVESRGVVTLQSDRTVAEGQGKWKLVLRNGDSLDGAPVGISGQSMQYAVAELGTILVPLKNLATMTAKDAKPAVMEAATDKDVIRLKNGDQVEGLIVGVDGEKLQVAANADTTNDIELKNVDRITFGGVAPARAIPPLSARITLITGSVLTVPLSAKEKTFSWSLGDVKLQDPAGKERKTTADKISSIEVLGGRVFFLTDLDPAKDVQSTYLGTKWPTQLNLNVLGQSLKVGKTVYPRGLGVHTRSILSYELDGSFETLTLRAGMDDSAAPHGEANLSVVLDGKTIWESKGMKAGVLSPEVKLTVKGGKMLELRAEPADKLDVLGRVNWIAPALIRP